MAKKHAHQSSRTTWSLLEHLGVVRKSIEPDGNCMFRALADQLYDDQDRHAEVRAKTIAHMRTHREVFEGNAVVLFLEGLESSQTKTRRQTRQKTPDDIFEEYCTEKEKLGTWGEEPEIVAFTEAFNRDVLIYRPDGQGRPISFYQNKKRPGAGVKYVQLAFGGEDVKPHYESVRPVGRRTVKVAAAAPSSKDMSKELFTEAKHPPLVDQFHPGPMRQLKKARPNLSSDDLIKFVDGCRIQLEDRGAALIDQDRKRAREDDNTDSEPPAKRATRGVNLRPRTRAFVSTSREGTEISFRVRLDTPGLSSADNEEGQDAAGEASAKPTGKGPGMTKGKLKKGTVATKNGRVQKGTKGTRKTQGQSMAQYE